MSSSNCCFMTCIQVSQKAGQVVWYSCLFQNFPQFIVIHTVKGFGIVNKAEVYAFLELSCFLMIHWMLAIWSLISLPFLKPAWTSGSSQFTYCQSLAWRIFSSVQSLSRVRLCNPMNCSTPGPPVPYNSLSLLKLMPIELVMPSSHLILCHPLLLLPPIPPSIRVFSSESTLHMRWPKYCSFSFSISPSNEHPGLISFRMDWLDLLAVQGTLKSLLEHHSSKHQFFSTQFSSQSNSHTHTWPLEKP